MPLEYALQKRTAFVKADPWKQPDSSRRIDASTGDEHSERMRMGIDYLPLQLVKHRKRRPFYFNIMVCGESGLGKTTLLNTLFNVDLFEQRHERITDKTVSIEPHVFELEEEDVTLILSLIDTPGFGDQLNRQAAFQPIMDYIDTQYASFHLQENQATPRRDIRDTRVHALIYFIPPTGHRLKELDVTFLSQLATKTNVIPVIAKADTMTLEERESFKDRVRHDLAKFDIKVFPYFSHDDFEDPHDLIHYMPFSVIGSTHSYVVGDKKVRGRQYRWGIAEVENSKHCDFVQLRELLVRSHMQDLIDACHAVHYFNFRAHALRSEGKKDAVLPSDEQYDHDVEGTRKSLQDEMKRREEDMRQNFFTKVKEKEASLRMQEEALMKKEREMMAEIEQLRRQLEAEEQEYEQLAAIRSSKKR